MEPNCPTRPSGSPVLRIIGVGDTGLSVIELMLADGICPDLVAAINTGGPALERSTAPRKVRLETRRLKGLGSGGDPERGRQAAEEQADQLKSLCENVDIVFILAGLGGGSGTGISPSLARIAKAAGALVLALVTLPFECEGSRRLLLADQGLEELRETADGIICLPNQKIFKLIEQNTSVVDTFKITNRFLADGVQGVMPLVAAKGLIQIQLDDVLRLLHGHSSECAFAVAQASGPERARQVIDKLITHPLLDSGEALHECESVLVSLTGGPNLTMSEVNLIMDQVKGHCGPVEVLMGAIIDESFQDRLAVTVITSKRPDSHPLPRGRASEGLHAQLLDPTDGPKPHSRFLPPPPALPPDQMQEMLARQKSRRPGVRKTSQKMRQAQLPLDIISKGRFDKSEPTIHKGEDLDVPTYIRRGVSLN
jgi:cell division protein FtsZ